MQSLIRSVTSLAALLFVLCRQTQGQNLVANPSFEDINICAEFAQPCSPSAWFFLSRKFTEGYYPRYPSATGERHLRMIAANRDSPNRQYWETKLLCPLQTGQRYTVSLKVAGPANMTELSKTRPNLRDVGMWFTDRFIFVYGDSILQPRTYLSWSDAVTTDLKNGWFEVKKQFTATANSSILIIGNFARASNADIIAQRNTSNPTIEVLVDDIAVTPVNGAVCATMQKTRDTLYGNIWRHSEDDPDHWIPTEANTPDKQGKTDQPETHHYSNDPIKDPLFGPEPHRVADTPKPGTPPHQEIPFRHSDTIVIHDIHFDFDKWLIQNPDTLQQYRALLTRPGIKKIQVVGFTDDAGSVAYNQELSQKRANEIARLLSSRFKIDLAIMSAEGRGISRKYPGKDLNRRVEIYIFRD